MIAHSDNTATNLVLDQIGLPSTNRTMERLGCPSTRVNAKVYRRDTSIAPEQSKQFGLGSTTAREMVRLLEQLHQEHAERHVTARLAELGRELELWHDRREPGLCCV